MNIKDMQNSNSYSLIILTMTIMMLSACSTIPIPKSDPEYASVRPVATKPLPITDGAIYKSGYEVSLFEDKKAKHVGDIITVMLIESTSAAKSASTTTKKDSDVSVDTPTFLGGSITANGVNFLDTTLGANRSFKGEGDSSQSNSLSGTITVTVADVLPNGNLVIRGEKMLTLNQGVEHIRLSGIVRPDDVTPSNTVPSTKLADAKIIYGGQGAVAESNTKGWLQRFIDGPWWPF